MSAYYINHLSDNDNKSANKYKNQTSLKLQNNSINIKKNNIH